ncbi:MAG: hypothetical protein QMD09_08465 [Desulfatibacillaceae bacterium]|nr:hypothetical protein [Desulfatibacillaceae bacterium]
MPNHLAYERATQWSQAQAVAKTGAKGGIYGAAAGALIGAAVGIVTGEDVAASVGKGAAVGGAAGATLGGAAGMDDSSARREIMRDLTDKSLENKKLPANGLAFGILFFPAEAQSASKLHLRIADIQTNQEYSVQMAFEPASVEGAKKTGE